MLNFFYNYCIVLESVIKSLNSIKILGEINMELNEKLYHVHSVYNFSRYLFLKIEHNYSAMVEKTSITLPQLRVLLCLKVFPGISLSEIANICSWSSPTVTNMLKILMDSGLVEKEENDNKKVYKLCVTAKGMEYIQANMKFKGCGFELFTLLEHLSCEELDFLNDMVLKMCNEEDRANNMGPTTEMIEKSLYVDYSTFDKGEVEKLKKLIYLYGILRVFILGVEGDHRQLLAKSKITYPQLRSLWIIKAFPGITSRQLSDISFWSPSTANLVVRNIYNKELLYKEKSKIKNALYLYVNDKGEKVLLDDFKVNQGNLRVVANVEGISKEDFEKMIGLLKRMNKVIKNDMVETYVARTFEVIKDKCS